MMVFKIVMKNTKRKQDPEACKEAMGNLYFFTVRQGASFQPVVARAGSHWPISAKFASQLLNAATIKNK